MLKTTEQTFASIQAEFEAEARTATAIAQLTKRGFVAHCEPTAEVMSEVSEDYFPGLRFV